LLISRLLEFPKIAEANGHLGEHCAEAILFAHAGDEPAMALTILPGTGVRLDPDQIAKVEICCADATHVEVRIFSIAETEHRYFAFPDKAAAVDFYRQVWLLRSGEKLGDGQIEDLMATSNGIEHA
jgi:hypothetical protein